MARTKTYVMVPVENGMPIYYTSTTVVVRDVVCTYVRTGAVHTCNEL